MVAQQTELEVVTEWMERLNLTNASVAMDQEEHNRQFAEYLSHIRDQSLITGFNETLWYGTAEQVCVMADGKLRFIFKGGQEVTV